MRRFLMIGALALIFVAPVAALAWAPGQPIVPACQFDTVGGGDGPYCTACDLVNLVNNLLAFAVYLTAFIATIMFAYAGFLYVTASASAENIQKAKEVFSKVLIGFIFVLTAWLIVDIILSVLTEKDFGFWTNLECTEYPTFEDAAATTATPGSGTNSCKDCVNIPLTIEQKGNIGGQVNRDLAGDLETLNGKEDDWRVTEAYPPTVTHKNNCHNAGTCVDVGFTNGKEYNQENIRSFIDNSKESGLRAVYESNDKAEIDALRAAGFSDSEVLYVEQITAPHFSVYD